MNERIQELTEQADNYAMNMNPEQDPYGRAANPKKFRQDRDTKFAELIVRECADFVYYKAEKSMSQEIVYVGNDLLQHFGVDK